jgi:hypothetical protein
VVPTNPQPKPDPPAPATKSPTPPTQPPQKTAPKPQTVNNSNNNNKVATKPKPKKQQQIAQPRPVDPDEFSVAPSLKSKVIETKDKKFDEVYHRGKKVSYTKFLGPEVSTSRHTSAYVLVAIHLASFEVLVPNQRPKQILHIQCILAFLAIFAIFIFL